MRPVFFILFLICTLLASSVQAQDNFEIPFDFCPNQGSANITFSILQDSNVQLVIEHVFNNIPVKTLLDENLSAGNHRVTWDGTNYDGQPVGTGIYIYRLIGQGWQIEEWGAIDCGWGAAIQSRVIVGNHDVSMSFTNIIEDVGATNLGIFSADGTTRLYDFSDLAYSRYSFFYWTFTDSFDQRFPAGDYIYRLTSPTYSEDVPFSLNPITLGSLSATITDQNGNLETGIFGAGDAPVVKGPLQQIEIDFGRAMNTAEIEYILNNGLSWDGAFEWAAPIAPIVRPDSTGVIFQDFELMRSWPDVWGNATVAGFGLFEPYSSRFRIGFDHEGITRTNGNCQLSGEIDENDWIINPGPFYFTPHGTMDPPCNNPVSINESTDIYYTIEDDGGVSMVIIDSNGYPVLQLVNEYQQAGSHFVSWDRLDSSGAEVDEGIYHFIWSIQKNDGLEVLTSGDIEINSVVADVPGQTASVLLPELLGNHPNPFNPATVISFSLPTDTMTHLEVLALDGKRLVTLLAGPVAAGRHSVVWNGRDRFGRKVPSGTYFYQLAAGGAVSTRRMMLLK